MPTMQTYINGLPKAELHMHLEGCIEPDMMFTLAERNGHSLRWPSAEALRSAYEFNDLQSFLDLYFEGCHVLVEEQDFYDVTHRYLQKAHEQTVRHAEMFTGPQTFTERGTPLEAVMEGVLGAMQNAKHEFGITSGLLISAHRHRTQEAAIELLDSIQPWRENISGIGMGGAELPNPPSKFVEFFARCRAQNLPVTIHAGEEGPADYIRQAIDLLHVNRIDHGNACLTDPSLVRELAERRIPLTVCPLSNLKLNVVPSDVPHPLRGMLDAGLCATINSDDPPYFGGYVNENFAYVQRNLKLTRNELVQLAKNSFEASFIDRALAQRYIDSVDAYDRSVAHIN
ncbi:adenosine deaminase [Paraburkholderia phymatum]|uniref:Adenine deaminase n=1 Tax=Paraburkholderia phymatum (strain DSM 17167 / CIP 108236 / LMG 21445 / STM815) TaxID=391038 RepID=B2JRM0_PARP8|nr:adenosine deaminase [Paraburkholderia phymatum]ACC72347.1 adenosine deaminase [Paraburkholderia phymatum STM815]